MSRQFTPKVVTANNLLDGESVWLTADNRWSGDMAAAELIGDESRAQLRLRWAEGQQHVIVGPYLTDAKAGPGGPEPVHFREVFRTRGPSNYAHGKQAEARHVSL